MDNRLLELNGITKAVKGQEINKKIRDEAITESNELALLRKEIMHIESALGIEPTTEFAEYCQKVEEIKQEVENDG